MNFKVYLSVLPQVVCHCPVVQCTERYLPTKIWNIQNLAARGTQISSSVLHIFWLISRASYRAAGAAPGVCKRVRTSHTEKAEKLIKTRLVYNLFQGLRCGCGSFKSGVPKPVPREQKHARDNIFICPLNFFENYSCQTS